MEDGELWLKFDGAAAFFEALDGHGAI